MARRTGYLDVNRGKHGFVWWLCVGWWERPIASFCWYLLADILGYKGVKYHYHR